MKKILILMVCLFSASAIAQDLFPELAGVGGRTRTPEKKVEIQKETVKVIAEDTKETTLQKIEEDALGEEDGLTEEDLVETTASESGNEVKDEVDLFATPAKKEEVVEDEEEDDEEEEDEEQKITIYMKDADATITPNRDFSYCFGIIKVLSTLKRPVEELDVVLKYGNLTSNYNIHNLMPKDEQTGTITLMGRACEHILDMPEMTINACRVEDMEEATCKKKVEFLPLRGE